eukprot:tig00000448_g855.t1
MENVAFTALAPAPAARGIPGKVDSFRRAPAAVSAASSSFAGRQLHAPPTRRFNFQSARSDAVPSKTGDKFGPVHGVSTSGGVTKFEMSQPAMPEVGAFKQVPADAHGNTITVQYTVDTETMRIPRITDYMPNLETYPSPLTDNEEVEPHWSFHGRWITDGSYVDLNIVHDPEERSDMKMALTRAGPRERVFFKPEEVTAAVVSCGGLCPGMNVVIRELVMTLSHNYGVKKILGIQCGYRGFYDEKLPPVELNPELVETAHEEGGTLLRSSRGGFDRAKIVDAIEKRGINMLYVIGGDGTHRGANAIYEECRKRGLKVAVAGIPKTIDNDIQYLDKSFGFDTAVEEAVKAIESAYVESRCYPNGIGVVKLMGRNSGFIAMHAALASRVVDVCLIPEITFHLNGKWGLLEHVRRVTAEKGHCVVVVAEGAGQELLPESGATDASGNKRLGDIGRFLAERIKAHYDAAGEESNVKYVDPTYMIRSVKANASDALYCSLLAQNAVHGTFAGFTGFSAGRVNHKQVYLPIQSICNKPRGVDPQGRYWYSLMFLTRQPDFNHGLTTTEVDCGVKLD